MIIYGRKAKVLAAETLTEKCPNCGAVASVQLSVIQKYGHVFWIPFFPMGKTGISQCSKCKQVLKLKDMPQSFKDSYDGLKAQAKTPVYMYSGIALIVIIFAAATYHGQQNAKKNAIWIANPQKGDIFEVKTKESQYTLYKVADVIGDTVVVRTNNYETSEESGLPDLKHRGDTSYAEETMPLLKPELKAMLDKGDIIDIDRK
jgi:hypothetical protein